jgi:hypothetical protein
VHFPREGAHNSAVWLEFLNFCSSKRAVGVRSMLKSLPDAVQSSIRNAAQLRPLPFVMTNFMMFLVAMSAVGWAFWSVCSVLSS